MQFLVFIAGFALLVSCVQASWSLKLDVLGKSGLHLTLADAALLAAALTLAVLFIRGRVRLRRFLPHWTVVALALAAAVALLAGPSPAGIKELIQLVEILCIGYILFDVSLDDAGAEDLLSALFLAASVITALVALYQRLGRDISPFEAGGFLENRNHLSAYLLLAVPWAVGRYLSPQAKARLGECVAAGILAIAGFYLAANVVVSLAMFAGAALALVAARPQGVVSGTTQKLFIAALAVAWIVATAVSGPVWDGLAVYRADVTGRMKPSARARRWQADITAVSENPLFGVGLGRYQTAIGKYYRGEVVKPDGMTDDVGGFDLRADEPGSQGMWEVVPVEGGLLLAAAWVVLLVSAVAGALKGGRPGVAGALLAALLGGFAVSVWVRGVGVALAFLIALSARKGGTNTGSPAP